MKIKQRLLDLSIFWFGASLLLVYFIAFVAGVHILCAFSFTGNIEYAGQLLRFWLVALTPFLCSVSLSFLAVLACSGKIKEIL